MSFDNIHIVLINTTHPGNVGGAARAMKNMGLRRLVLVDPQRYPSAEATARASGADDVLAGARVCAGVDEAVADSRLIIGASARLRTIAWPQLDARAAAGLAVREATAGAVSILFGREHSGLSNAELDRCHYLLHIPCDAAYPSLNLAAAVQVVAYELRMAALGGSETAAGAARLAKARPTHGQGASTLEAHDAPADGPRASAAEMERFYTHLERVLIDIRFLNPDYPRKLMRRLRRLFNRAAPDQQEMNILRGILTAVEARCKDAAGPE